MVIKARIPLRTVSTVNQMVVFALSSIGYKNLSNIQSPLAKGKRKVIASKTAASNNQTLCIR
jgi:hypothetical protein